MPIPSDGRKWTTNECRIKMDPPGLDPQWRPTVLAAADMWNAAGANFRFVEDSASSNHVAAYDLGRWNGWIALTQTRPKTPNSALTSATVLVNLHYGWNPSHPSVQSSPQGQAYDLQTVVAHELGHALHLGDDNSPGSTALMKGSIKPGEVRNLSRDDTSAIKLLYP